MTLDVKGWADRVNQCARAKRLPVFLASGQGRRTLNDLGFFIKTVGTPGLTHRPGLIGSPRRKI